MKWTADFYIIIFGMYMGYVLRLINEYFGTFRKMW